ncbi:MAG: HAD family phosphatase [Lachnospiraceae bacterium]|nr:HAD family phosphatase [Lachnospiraceae bacterium]
MKILFTDLDGTLLNNESKVIDYSIDVLKRMTAAGHKLVLASGRPLGSILEIKELAGLDMPGVYVTANNGSLIYDCDTGVIIFSDPVPMNMVTKVWDLAHEMGVHIQTYTDDSIVTLTDDPEIRKYTIKIHIPVIYADRPETILVHAPSKMLAISLADFDRLERFRQEVLNKHGDILDAIYSEPEYLEIYSKTAGKGAALKWLCEHLKVPIENSFAAGDAMNDISMIEAAGHGIVMCNASKEVKEHADIVTEYDNDKDGLAREIERLILL